MDWFAKTLNYNFSRLTTTMEYVVQQMTIITDIQAETNHEKIVCSKISQSIQELMYKDLAKYMLHRQRLWFLSKADILMEEDTLIERWWTLCNYGIRKMRDYIVLDPKSDKSCLQRCN
jgi:hypothetical protein